jgi:hypothetical protein
MAKLIFIQLMLASFVVLSINVIAISYKAKSKCNSKIKFILFISANFMLKPPGGSGGGGEGG